MTRDELLKELMELDFTALDLALFLNTHPEDTEAIAQYNKTIMAADMVRERFEDKYGPLCSFRSLSNKADYTWIDNPWPWQNRDN